MAIADHNRVPTHGLFSEMEANKGPVELLQEYKLEEVVLKPGEQLVFKHQIVIGGDLTDAEINSMALQVCQ